MIIKKFILHRFKRFFLSGVETFHYIPTNNLTIISWPNGMGKSSFLSQLNPLPADLKKDYKEDGYKYIEFSYNNDNYIISSGYVESNKHSFIKNDEELNPGGTISIQKQLVQEHLNLTSNINQILLGNENLTSMSLNNRKYWFTQLSPIDYDYPISVYQNIKSKLRDLIGNIKITQDEVVKRSNFIIDKETQEEYKKNIESIEKVINNISIGYSNMIKPELNLNIEETIKKMKFYISEDQRYETMFAYDEQELLLNKGKLEQHIKNQVEKLTNLDKLLKTVEQTENKTEQEKIKKDFENLNIFLEKNINKNIDYNNIYLCKTEFEKINANIRNILNVLLDSNYRDIDYKDKTIEKTYESINNLKSTYDKINVVYSVNTEKIKNLLEAKEHDDIKCPKCNHTWKQGYDEKELEKLKETQDEYKKQLLSIKNKYIEYNTLYQKQITKKETVGKLINYLSNPLLSHWFDKLLSKIEEDLNFDYLNTDLNKIIIDIDNHIEIYKKIKLKEEYEEKIRNVEMTMKIKNEFQIETKDKIEKDINDLMLDIDKSKLEINKLNSYIENRKRIFECKNDIKKYLKYRREEFKYNVITKRNELITEAIGKLKSHLSELTKVVNDNEGNKKVIDSLQALINSNKKDIKVLQLLVKILSPESGLIAQSMNSFLNVFIEDMNTLINQVWTYPIEILPCEIENNELSYRFKVKINHDEIVEDVSKLSSSQKEIVDLSFKVMFMKYMSLENYPLFLDEFGKTMDAEHRISAFDVIDKVLTNNFNLTILVCHFETMYTRFVNAQILELKESK